jgi:ABC-2 type transport system permease protein
VNNTPKPLHYLRVLLQADFVVLLRSKRAIIVSILLPLYILFISKSSKAQSKLGGSHFLVILAITLGLLSLALMGYALNVARDRERGVFQRLRVTPVPTWVIMMSRLLVQVAIGEIITVAVLIVGSRMDHISLSVGEYLSTLLVTLLEAAVFLSVGQALVGLVKSAATVYAVGSLLYVVLFMSGFLGISGALGSTFQTFAYWTPVGTITAIFQSVLHQAAWNGHTTLSLLACFGYIAVCGFIGIKWFQWEAR